MRHHDEEPTILSMGGRNWIVTSLDYTFREAFVAPEDASGKSRWQGGTIGMSWRFARAVHHLPTYASKSALWTHSASTALTALRQEHDFLRAEADVTLTERDRDEVHWSRSPEHW